ncbi:TetR/AcrR family transcriptional regulator [Streptomyces candidus]|uniref:AcrR family transcriptional regulator n=1 Tax=Streptomyces candidus TaxID=67283 RepID=A0A7X0HL21_9ACTN|nr:TetR/AcrR family transcriptional regulator [Streptomyces candidus]MBB6439460.1 AcrR family transcriptional regulator [Streptomyces candidus]GHH56576.1 TetR family transcriptional regulator [Streptomyces candidus]
MPERPLRRDAERNRQLLLETAHALMARDGLEVTYEEIAIAAGTGMGTVYRRFPDRQKLVDILFAEHIDAVVELARQACQSDNPWTGLTWFMEQQLELEAGNRGLGQLLRGGRQSSELVMRGRAQITPLVTDLLERAIRSHQLPATVMPADLVTIHLMVGAVMDAARHIDPDLWRRALTMALTGLRHAELPVRQPDDELIDRLFGVPATARDKKAANEPAE